MKTKRQRKIIELITNYDIETQEELAAKLVENGFNVTQATISRDIRELNLTKIATKVKTVSGMAMAVAAALDAMQIKEILGCIAGDDTIMCVVKHAEETDRVKEHIESFIR